MILEGYNDPDMYAEKPIYIDDLSINWYNAMKKYYIKNLSIDSCFVDSHLKAIAAGKFNLAMCTASDVASNSFGYYLGEYYGETILIEIAKNISNPMSVIGKSWQQLFTEWEIWIKATFGEYFE